MKPINDDYKPTANPELTTTRVEDELVVLNEDQKQVHKLNESAAFVFELCRSGYTVGSIKAEFLVRYEVDQKIAEKDVDNLLESLLDFDLIS